MKSSLLIFVTLLMLATPAAAMSVDHDSNYADSSGSSRFSDPDDQLNSSNQLGMVQLGNSDSNSSGITFGMFATGSNDGQNNPPPGYYGMQGSAPRWHH